MSCWLIVELQTVMIQYYNQQSSSNACKLSDVVVQVDVLSGAMSTKTGKHIEVQPR